MSVEYSDFFDDTKRSLCCGASELQSDFCAECREHAGFERQCENFDYCGNWIDDCSNNDECQECEDAYDRANPHPLDIAEREEREAECFGLDPPPWKGEF
jgi:hypothetical protein